MNYKSLTYSTKNENGLHQAEYVILGFWPWSKDIEREFERCWGDWYNKETRQLATHKDLKLIRLAQRFSQSMEKEKTL